MKLDKKKLMLAMANACMNTADIQAATGMPRPTLNGAISGKTIRPATAGKIAKALGVNVSDILAD